MSATPTLTHLQRWSLAASVVHALFLHPTEEMVRFAEDIIESKGMLSKGREKEYRARLATDLLAKYL